MQGTLGSVSVAATFPCQGQSWPFCQVEALARHLRPRCPITVYVGCSTRSLAHSGNPEVSRGGQCDKCRMASTGHWTQGEGAGQRECLEDMTTKWNLITAGERSW